MFSLDAYGIDKKSQVRVCIMYIYIYIYIYI